MPSNPNRFAEFKNALMANVDFVQLYRELGCHAVGQPDGDGWMACKSHHSFGGDDRNPSAQFNIKSGVYIDFRAKLTLSPWDFMVAVGQATDWREAQRSVASRFGVKPPSVSKSHAANGVEWLPWKDSDVYLFCKNKPPITVEGIRASGACLCKRFGTTCLAWPIYDDCLDVIGYYFMRSTGEPFDHDSAKGAKGIPKRHRGLHGGFVGKPGVSYALSGADDRPLYWCEGVPDMVAAYSVFLDDKCFIANVNGAGERLRENQASVMSQSKCKIILVADADEPGMVGAKMRHFSIREHVAEDREVIVCRPPDYEITPKHGKDLRDYLAEKHEDYTGRNANACELEKDLVKCEIQQEEECPNEEQLQAAETAMRINNKVLNSLGFEVMSIDADGSVLVDCHKTNRRRRLKKISDFTYLEGVALGGSGFASSVCSNPDTAEQAGKLSMNDVLVAVAESMSRTENTVTDVAGNGLWMLGPASEVYVVNAGRFYRHDGARIVPAGRNCVHKRIADISNSMNWVDFAELEKYLGDAQDPGWRIKVHNQLDQYISSWNWASEHANEVVCGLIYATWLQTMWQWRPNVLIVGESSSGKTTFLNLLSQIFLNACPPSASSTASGIMQSIGNDALAVLIDEFDNGATEQKKILTMLRGNSRGERVLRGTPSQHVRSYKINHIPWISGIHMASNEQADINRLIEIELNALPGYTLRLPDLQEAHDLGYKILASAITVARDALAMAKEVTKGCKEKGSFMRQHESYTVPYSCLGAMIGSDSESVVDLMLEYMASYVMPAISGDAFLSDQEELLYEIFHTPIDVSRVSQVSKSATPAQILTDIRYASCVPELEPRGIRLVDGNKLALHIRSLVDNGGILERSRRWSGNFGLHKVLKRLHALDPETQTVKIAGVARHCTTMSWSKVLRFLHGKPSDTLFDLD